MKPGSRARKSPSGDQLRYGIPRPLTRKDRSWLQFLKRG
ncbi:unnamed protein product [Brassica oleracea]